MTAADAQAFYLDVLAAAAGVVAVMTIAAFSAAAFTSGLVAARCWLTWRTEKAHEQAREAREAAMLEAWRASIDAEQQMREDALVAEFYRDMGWQR